MKIKYLLLSLLLLLATTTLKAESYYGDNCYAIGAQAGYGYNHTYLHYGQFGINAFLPIHRHFEGEVNLRATTASTYSVNVRTQPKFMLPVGELYLRTQIQYNLILRDRFQGLNGIFGVGYRMDYVDVMVAYGTRVMATLDMVNTSTEHGISEPHNFVYRVEAFVRPHTSPWNLSFWASNLTDYQMERMFTPLFGARARVTLAPGWQLNLYAMVKPVGISNLAPSFYGAEAGVGCMYLFNHSAQ